MSEYNLSAHEIAMQLHTQSDEHRVEVSNIGGATVFDLGINVRGGIVAGEVLAEVCMGGAADIFSVPDPTSEATGITVRVATDNPVWACLACQYAGWPLSTDDYFAMTSGPIRMLRGKEPVLEHLSLQDDAPEVGVAVLEADTLPTLLAVEQIAKDAGLKSDQLTILVAPTTSIAGNVQVVARSVETAMHKLHELGFDVRRVISAAGSAPLSPPAKKSIDGIGRTNDAILYGGCVTLFVDCEQAKVDEIGPQVPSNASADFGRPFGEIFKSYEYDFYKVDPNLFSPAVVKIVNLESGIARSFGELRPDILRTSFGL